MSDLCSLCDVGCVSRAGADTTGLVLKQNGAGYELWVLVISVLDSDADIGAGVIVLGREHLLKHA